MQAGDVQSLLRADMRVNQAGEGRKVSEETRGRRPHGKAESTDGPRAEGDG